MHCVACDEFKPFVEVILRGIKDRQAIDEKLFRALLFKELASIFNTPEIVFDNFFEDHEHGDKELRNFDPNNFTERPKSVL